MKAQIVRKRLHFVFSGFVSCNGNSSYKWVQFIFINNRCLELKLNWTEFFWSIKLNQSYRGNGVCINETIHLHFFLNLQCTLVVHQSYLELYESCRNGSSLQPKAPSERETPWPWGFGLKGAPTSSLSPYFCVSWISINSKA